MPQQYEPDRPPADPERVKWILMALIAVFGVVFFAITVRSGRTDSALLFVGLPCLLALLLVRTPARSPHGRVAIVTTIGLLLAAAALHEGAICVLLAAPLVFAVAHSTTALVRAVRESRRSPLVILPLPLLLLGGVEGVDQDLRIRPDQSAAVTRTVALSPEQVRARLETGPQPVDLRQLPLRLLNAPAPMQVAGNGLDPGDMWVFGYPGSSHGTGGAIVTQVSESDSDHVRFTVAQDGTITSRWLRWRGAEVRWHAIGGGRTEVTVALDYTRRLDPSWYFGPIQDGLMRAGAAHMLDMLDLR